MGKQLIDYQRLSILRDDFLKGDNDAFAQLYKILAPVLYSIGLSLRARKSLIEDAIHDTFEDFYLHREALRNVDNLKLYFMAAFRNKLFGLVKSETINIQESHELKELLFEKDHLNVWIEKESIKTQKKLLEKLMAELTPSQREVIFYRFNEGLTLDEISVLMNINYQSVKNLIYRSVKKLGELKNLFLQFSK